MATPFPGPAINYYPPAYTHDTPEGAINGDDAYAFSTICESHFPANLLACTDEPKPPTLFHSTQHLTHWHDGIMKNIYPVLNSATLPSTLPYTNGENAAHSHNICEEMLLSEPFPRRIYPHMPNTRTQRQGGAHEGLDAMTRRVVEALQRCGKATFHELNKLTGVDTRRLYDITNLLASTPFVSKAGRKRERAPFIFGDGTATDDPVAIEHILLDIELEQVKILTLLDTFNRRAKEGGQLMFTC